MKSVRTVSGPTESVVVVGAGLGGLACALHLAGAGRQVTVLEREPVPGGRAGRLTDSGYEFDTGPTVLTMPDLIAEALDAVGENLTDWLDLTPLDPAYRAHYPDGSTLDVVTDTVRMAAEISRVCGPREADGYLRFADYSRRLWQLERADFIDKNFDAPTDLLTANLVRLLMAGGFRRLQTKIDQFFRDPRTRRIFSFQSMYAGLAPHDALALYAVIAYLDSVAGVYYPAAGSTPCRGRWPGRRRSTASRSGTGSPCRGSRPRPAGRPRSSRPTVSGCPPTSSCSTPTCRSPIATCCPSPASRASCATRPPASCYISDRRRAIEKIAHHNIHFGRSWKGTFTELIDRGELMSDPSLLVTNPSRTDPSVAPADRQTYYVLAPVPNLDKAPFDWRGDFGADYADRITRTLEERGYVGFADAAEVRWVVTPADWADAGMAAGTPFAAAHSLFQTGPFRPGNLHPTLSNVVFVGSGTQPGVGVPMVLISGKLAAGRVVGGLR